MGLYRDKAKGEITDRKKCGLKLKSVGGGAGGGGGGGGGEVGGMRYYYLIVIN